MVEVEQPATEPGVWKIVHRETRFDRPLQVHAPGTADVDGAVLVREMGQQDIHPSVAVNVPDADAHAGFRCPVAVDRDSAGQGLFGKRPVTLIDPKMVALPVVGHVDVHPAVIGQVQADGAETLGSLASRGRTDARLRGDLHECPVPRVAVQRVRHAVEDPRAAVVRGAGVGAARLVDRQVVVDVVDDVQVEMAVAVVVAEDRAGAPVIPDDARAPRDVHERPVAVVTVEPVRSIIRHVNVRVAVVVDVPDRYALTPSRISETAAGGLVGEPTVGLPAVEPVGRRGIGVSRWRHAHL